MLVLLTSAGGFVYWRVEYALDRGLDDDLSTAASTLATRVGEDGEVSAPLTGTPVAAWQVLDADGQVLDSSTPGEVPLLPVTELPTDHAAGDTVTEDVGSLLPADAGAVRVRAVALGTSGTGRPAWLLVAVDRAHRDEALRELVLQLSLTSLGALVVSGFVGDLLARAALRPVERYRTRALQIADGAKGGLALRLDVPPDRDDEITRLGATFNHLLDVLAVALEREQRFVRDAGHELRTPLTLLRTRIQLTLRRERSTEELRAALRELEVDVDALAELASVLLAGAAPESLGSGTDADATARAVLRDYAALVPGDDLRTDLGAPGARVSPPPSSLSRTLVNLLDNARAHGAAPVTVTSRTDAGHYVLAVADAGPGMPPALLATATERFVRGDEARGRAGSGLGLSLVAGLLPPGGELRLCQRGEHRVEGPGSAGAPPCAHTDAFTVTVVLPLVTGPPPGTGSGPGATAGPTA
ncbi:HAMP domain-containing protein [Nocardioides sp. GY 10127]|nr:HAMP domain-containing protein [Nocardioides sp. GY 10127]